MTPRALYPLVEPNAAGRLAVGDGHEIHWEICGNPGGKPAVFLHGGPGGGFSPEHRRLFDPARYRVLLFDQRGCGHSTPARLPGRQYDLASRCGHRAPARAHGGRAVAGVRRLVGQHTCPGLRPNASRAGVRAGPARDLPAPALGAALVLPARRLAPVPGQVGAVPGADPRRGARRSYRRLPPPPDRSGSRGAARPRRGPGACGRGRPSHFFRTRATVGSSGTTGTRGRSHGSRTTISSMPPGWRRASSCATPAACATIPAVIVQGRYDIATPPASAWDLHRAWPESEFHLIEGAGHAYSEPGIQSALLAATDRFANR